MVLEVSKLSQANQAYIKSLKNKQTPTHTTIQTPSKNQDAFISSKKKHDKFLKLGLLGGAAIVAGLTIASAIKKQKLPSFTGIDEKIPFNHEKLFTEPINLDKYYQQTLDSIKDIQLTYSFDEKTVTDAQIADALKKIGFPEFSIPDRTKFIKQNPSLLHTLNILSEFNEGDHYGKLDIINGMDINTPIDEIDNIFKYFTKIAPDEVFLFVGDSTKAVTKYRKEVMGLEGLLNYIISKMGIENSTLHVTKFALDKDPVSPKNLDEFLKFIGSLETGTFENSASYELHLILNGIGTDIKNYRMARKFYENLKPEVIEKLSIGSIGELLSNKNKSSIEISKILNETPNEVLEKLSKHDISTYVDFREFYGIENINQLSMAQKRKLLRQIVSSNSSAFLSSKTIAKILPSNQEEYCKLMDKLAKSIGVNTTKLTSEELTNFNKAIEEISETIQCLDLNNTTFKLDFSRQDFIEQVKNELENLTEKEKMEVMDYFGFELKGDKLIGYPLNINNGEKLNEITSDAAKNAINSLRSVVDRFSSKNNKVTVIGASKEFEASVNKIFESFPELRTMIQKAQHETHAFTLDIHVFKVLQDVCSNPKFKELSDDDKKILEISALLHDITKLEKTRDYMHPIESAFDSYYIIQKLNLPESQQLKIYELIKTHNWLQQLNDPKNKDIIENIAQDIAFDARHTNTFEMAKILCEADLKSVRKDASFFNNHKKNLEIMSAKVDSYVNQLHKTQIILPQTVIPKASQIQNGVLESADGVQNIVLYMDKADEDLSKYGFAKDTTKTNWMGLVHALGEPEQMSKFDTFNIIDTEALVSTSFINPNEYKVFRKQGVILDVNFNDIHAGYETDFGSGYTKTLDILKEDYLFHGKRKELSGAEGWRHDRTYYRTFISDKIKKQLGLSDKEYYKRIENLQGCKSITDIEKVDREFAEGLVEVFKNMHATKRRGGRMYNEILITRPKIQGVFAYDKEYKKIPLFLRQYAAEHDLPIIIFGSK